MIDFELALGSNRPDSPDQTQNPRILGRQRPGIGLDLAAHTHTASPRILGLWLALPSIELATWRWLLQWTSLDGTVLRWLLQVTSFDLAGSHWLPDCDVRDSQRPGSSPSSGSSGMLTGPLHTQNRCSSVVLSLQNASKHLIERAARVKRVVWCAGGRS